MSGSAFPLRVEFALHRVVPGTVLLAAYAAVAAGAQVPPALALGLAMTTLCLWPGSMLLRFLLVENDLEWPGRLVYSFALGLLLAGIVAFAAHTLSFDFGVAMWILPLVGLVLACLRTPVRVEAPDTRGALPWLLLAIWAAGLSIVIGTLGAPLMMDTDSPDHIATIRRIVEAREVFPVDAFFADAGPHGADPRKSLYHAWVALLVRATHLDPVSVWHGLPFFLIPLFALTMHVFTFAVTGSRATGVIAALLFPFLYGGGPGGTELRETVYSTRVGEMVSLAAAAALVRHVEGGTRRRLLLFVATAASAIVVHVWYVLYMAIAFGAYGAATLFVRRRETAIVRRLWAAAAGLVITLGPYLAYRAGQAYAPSNVIHTEPQGLLYLTGWTDRLFVVEPLAVWAWNGPWLLVALAAVPWFWSRRKESTGSIYLAVVTPAVLLIVWNPLLLPWVESKLGYLTMRLIQIAPVIPAVATVLAGLGRAGLRATRGARAAAAAVVLLLLGFVLPQAGQALTLLTERSKLLAFEAGRGPASWFDLLAYLRDDVPGPRVILTDPATSYSIPAYTGHQVSAYLDQHSSPNDPKGLERILDARDVLSPYVGLGKTIETLREYQVDLIALNQRFTEPMQFDYWSVSPTLYAGTRAKFDRHPELFRPVWRAPGIVVYEVTEKAKHGPILDEPPASRPFTRPLTNREAHAHRRVLDGRFVQRGTDVPFAVLAGDTLDLVTYWSVADSVPEPGRYVVWVRLTTPVPEGPLFHTSWSKLYRKVVERLEGRRYRLRQTHVPLGGMYGPDLWRPGEVIEDHFRFPITADAALGRYEVRVKMMRMPHYPNTRLKDYVSDDDQWSGPIAGSVYIVK